MLGLEYYLLPLGCKQPDWPSADPKTNSLGAVPGSPGEGQGQCQEDQGILKQLGGVHPWLFYYSLVLLAFPITLPWNLQNSPPS